MTDLITIKRAAENLGVSRRTIERLMERGELPFHQFTENCRRIDPDDLQRIRDETKTRRERVTVERPGLHVLPGRRPIKATREAA